MSELNYSHFQAYEQLACKAGLMQLEVLAVLLSLHILTLFREEVKSPWAH